MCSGAACGTGALEPTCRHRRQQGRTIKSWAALPLAAFEVITGGGGNFVEILLAENVFSGSRVAAVNELSRLAVNGCMAHGAKRDQVLFGVVAGVTPKLSVMDF